MERQVDALDAEVARLQNPHRPDEAGQQVAHLLVTAAAVMALVSRLQEAFAPSPLEAALPSGLADAEARGEMRLVQWTQDGTLVPGSTLSGAWGISRQALDQAADRDELFFMRVARKRYYPGLFQSLSRLAVTQVCRALQGVEPAGQLIFWLRKHGSLNGRTVSEGLQAGELSRVLELARAWAEERVDQDPQSVGTAHT